jgi:hypothetical protein
MSTRSPLLSKPRSLVGPRGPLDYSTVPLPRLNEITAQWEAEFSAEAIVGTVCGKGSLGRLLDITAARRKLLDN